MKIGYAFVPDDAAFVARATGKEIRVKSKDCWEVCAAVQGMMAEEAKKYLESVLAKKAYIPQVKSKTQGGHKKGMSPAGFQPVKSVDAVLGILNSAIANAEFKGLEISNCEVISALAQRGRKMRRMKPKGRNAVFFSHLTNIQIVLQELPDKE
jgi:large subunit ribosomal protein L22